MKKIFAVLLIVAMLIPMGLTVQAEEITAKPFYISNWKNDETKYSHIYEAAYFWSNSKRVAEGESHVSAARLPGGGNNENIPLLAANLKAEFDTYPEGARNITLCLAHTAIAQLSEVCFSDKAVPVVTSFLEEFLAEYKRIGGKLDNVNVDIEYLNIYYHYIHENFFKNDPDVYNKIAQHPTYINVIRPQLVERGFKFYENVTDATPEIFSIYPNSGSQYATSRAIWNSVMRNYQCQIITDMCAPLWKYYPDATVQDYKAVDIQPWLKVVSDSGGYEGSGGNKYVAGNCGDINFYFVRPNTSFFKENKTPTGYNNTQMENNHFTTFLFDMNIAANTYLGSENGRYVFTIAHPYYGSRAMSPYYSETNYHLGLLNPEFFLGYILQQDCKTDGTEDVDKFHQALKIANQNMVELSNLVGYSDRKVIYAEPNWNHNYVLTGMYANGRNIYRLTPNQSADSLEDFVVDRENLTFKIGDETVMFPGGKIIADSPVDVVGTWGFWIETAADVMPVTKRSNDYYRNNPAYLLDFESYAVGAAYDFNAGGNFWEVKKVGTGSGTIVADPANPNNKMVAFTGNYNARNITLLKNVSAGDSYAKHQAWEISAQLPADLAADAEIILLNATNEKQKTTDGGFKISGGKVYYSQNGEYVEFSGVALAANTRYSFVRDMNFTDEANISCDYYIYGPDGAVVAKQKDVPVEKLILPIYGISYSCSNVAGEAVLFDDYKIYATQVTTDYFLYDADTGMKVEEIDKAREGNTAYRLSWMNATNKEKSYTVMAAYYDGETLISEEAVKEIKMAPNTDGVDFGVVENKQEGKKMLVYLKDNNPAEEDETSETPADSGATAPTAPAAPTEEPAPKNNMVIIIAAAAAVVVIAVVVVVVVASKKKKKATPAAPVAEEKPEETPEEKPEE